MRRLILVSIAQRRGVSEYLQRAIPKEGSRTGSLRQRQLWSWVPGRRPLNPTRPPLLPGLSFEHPDNLSSDQRYHLKMTGPVHLSGTETIYTRIPLTTQKEHRNVRFSFAIGPGWQFTSGDACQLVWDVESQSVAVYTERDHPVPGSKRYLKDLLVTARVAGTLLLQALVERGHITQEGENALLKPVRKQCN